MPPLPLPPAPACPQKLALAADPARLQKAAEAEQQALAILDALRGQVGGGGGRIFRGNLGYPAACRGVSEASVVSGLCGAWGALRGETETVACGIGCSALPPCWRAGQTTVQ